MPADVLFGVVLFEVAELFCRWQNSFAELAVVVAYLCGLGLIFAIHVLSVVPERLVIPLTAAVAGLNSFALCGFCFHGQGRVACPIQLASTSLAGEHELFVLPDSWPSTGTLWPDGAECFLQRQSFQRVCIGFDIRIRSNLDCLHLPVPGC
jgi:hypothetical protein